MHKDTEAQTFYALNPISPDKPCSRVAFAPVSLCIFFAIIHPYKDCCPFKAHTLDIYGYILLVPYKRFTVKLNIDL
ncbi:hypothetical protein KDK_76150 [Dictyobacter kobayashii]|uniref:Uncharacterized protein n=1 Tax=Dictyobacter kobayashii TaxID=2014872 RepID=A0A402AXK1_9CHLR|nr:hypothetical protein KDK_76150 [Dictyobacter kobayashii]